MPSSATSSLFTTIPNHHKSQHIKHTNMDDALATSIPSHMIHMTHNHQHPNHHSSHRSPSHHTHAHRSHQHTTHPHPPTDTSDVDDYVLMDARQPRISPSNSPPPISPSADEIFNMSLQPHTTLPHTDNIPTRPRSSPPIHHESICESLQALSMKDITCIHIHTSPHFHDDICDTDGTYSQQSWDQSQQQQQQQLEEDISPRQPWEQPQPWEDNWESPNIETPTNLPSTTSSSASPSQSHTPSHTRQSLSPSPTASQSDDDAEEAEEHLLDDVAWGTPPKSPPIEDDDDTEPTPQIRRPKIKRTSAPTLHVNVNASPPPSHPHIIRPQVSPINQHTPHIQQPSPQHARPMMMIPQGMLLGLLSMNDGRNNETPTHVRCGSEPSSHFNRKTRSSPIAITQSTHNSPVTTPRRINEMGPIRQNSRIQPLQVPQQPKPRTGRATSDIIHAFPYENNHLAPPPVAPYATPLVLSRTIQSRHSSEPPVSTTTSITTPEHCPAPLHRGSGTLRSPPVFHPSSRNPNDSPPSIRRTSTRQPSNEDIRPPLPSPPKSTRRSPGRILNGGIFQMDL